MMMSVDRRNVSYNLPCMVSSGVLGLFFMWGPWGSGSLGGSSLL